MQLDSRRRGGTQHILEWRIFGLIFRRKVGVLLLKDWQSQHIAEGDQKERQKNQHLGDEGEKKQNRKESWKLKVWGICLASGNFN